MARIITGIEISRNIIQAVELSVQRSEVRVLGFVEELLDEAPLTPETLSHFVSTHGLRTDYVVTSVPGDMLITRNISVPFRERSKIDKIIRFEMEPLVPFPIQELEISYRILHQEKGKSDLLVYALPQNILDERSRLFEGAGIPLRMMTVSSLASANALFQSRKIPQQGTFLHLHISSNFSILSVYKNGELVHLQRVHWGEEAFFQKLQEITNLDPAALYKRLYELSSSEITEFVDALKSRPLEVIDQIRKGLQAYLMPSQGESPEALFVTGAAPGLRILPPLLEEALSIRAEIPDTLSCFSHDLKKPVAASGIHAPLGMALMESGKDALESLFRHQRYTLFSRILESRQEVRYAAFILLFLVCAIGADFFVGIQAKEHHYKELKKESLRIFQQTFPNVKNVANELAQMKLKIKEIEKQNEIFKSLFGEKPSTLEILNELSTLTPQEIELGITDLTIDGKSIRFVGWTDSFNSVNKIEQELKKSEIFGTVKVSNAKVGKDKSRVNFQMKIAFKES